MSRRIFAITFCMAMLCSIGAQASDATDMADRAGFLLGQSYRCGVEHTRIAQSQALITELIVAFATEDDDKEAATNQFTKSYVAGTLPEISRDPVASCKAVRAALNILEQHRLKPAVNTAAKLSPNVMGQKHASTGARHADVAASTGWGE